MTRRPIVLLSGGLDSTTVLAVAQDRGFEDVHALSFNYGQRHSVELEAARRVAASAGVAEHIVLDIDLRAFGGSALTDDLEVPHHDDPAVTDLGVPVTYVPARNTIFLSFALAYAETRDVHDIFIGVSAVDYSGYPDCRPEYIAAYQSMARLATRDGIEGRGVTIHAPLIDLSKAETIRLGLSLGVDYAATWSCYDPDARGLACGRCDSCQLRLRGFAEAGATDPAPYRSSGTGRER